MSSAPTDLLILSATPAGIAAAVAAARRGRTVRLLERTAHLGGLPANGLGATDIQTRGATGGFFLEFVRGIRAHYVGRHGPDSPQVRDCSDGYNFEPAVAERVLGDLLAAAPGVIVHREVEFAATPDALRWRDGRPVALRATHRRTGRTEWFEAAVLVDASYEGDLAAAAGAEFRLGREAAAEHGEPMAGVVYAPWRGAPDPGSTGAGDEAIQAYNYRLCLTRDPATRRPFPRPAGYRREEYLSLADDITAGRWTGPIGRELELDGIGRAVNLVPLPNGKFDANNQHLGFLSTDLPEENWPWPVAGWAERDAFAARLRDYTLGLLWFCQHDESLPADFRARCADWGLAGDEYADNGHFPRQVYVREARRIVGRHLFTAHDTLPVGPGGRPPVHRDSITASHYPLDSHAVRKREPGRPHLEGFFNLMNVPYTVPFGVIVPRSVPGLLVPVAASATHVGYSSLRMEPCWMALGQAAGTAAALGLDAGIPPAEVPVPALQEALLADGAVLVYFRDLSPGDPAFPAAQRLALRGALGEWTARPAEPVEPAVAARWQEALGRALSPRPGEARGSYLARLGSPAPEAPARAGADLSTRSG